MIPHPDLLTSQEEERQIEDELRREPRPLPEDPPLMNRNTVPIYMTLSQTAGGIIETRKLLARLPHDD